VYLCIIPECMLGRCYICNFFCYVVVYVNFHSLISLDQITLLDPFSFLVFGVSHSYEFLAAAKFILLQITM
jgi:hypothetical protein